MLKYILSLFSLHRDDPSDEVDMYHIVCQLDDLDRKGVDVPRYLSSMYRQDRPYLAAAGIWTVGKYIVWKQNGRWNFSLSKHN